MDHAVMLQAILRSDPVRWRILDLVRSIHLPDCWVGAGFVRNAVWDHLHDRAPSPLTGDVDVLWFNADQADPAEDARLNAVLGSLDPSVKWSVKNQAKMHLRNGDDPYASAVDAMRFWPETATAVAARKNGQGLCEVAAPLGLHDLFGLVLRPTPQFACRRREISSQRIRAKRWLEVWPLLRAEA